jgi:hypothetical protein
MAQIVGVPAPAMAFRVFGKAAAVLCRRKRNPIADARWGQRSAGAVRAGPNKKIGPRTGPF